MSGQVLVRKRLVIFLPGFEAMSSAAHARRFLREARRTAPVYDITLPDEMPISEDGGMPVAGIAAVSQAGLTQTELHVDSLDEIAALYTARGSLRRLGTGYVALLDFVFSGTGLRYARTSWRYVLFFLYPLILPLLALVSGWLVWLLTGSVAAGFLAGALAAAAFAWITTKRLHLMLVLDDWAFARDLVHGRQPAFAAAVDRLAARAKRRVSEEPFEEIVLAAHSLGAIAAVALAARLARSDGDALPRIGLLTVGSSLMKVALHPSAAWLRRDVQTVADNGVAWLDVQSLTDPIHFYKSHPVRSLGLADAGSIRTMRVRFRDQLDPERYRRVKIDLFAVHRQFVGGVHRWSSYAFHVILLGPERFETVAARPGLEQKDPRRDD